MERRGDCMKNVEREVKACVIRKNKKSIVIGKVAGDGIKMRISSPRTVINYERWKHE